MTDLALLAPLLEPGHHEIAERLGPFTCEHLGPVPDPEEDGAARRRAREILELLGREGWAAYAVPAEHGGAEAAGARSSCLIREALAAASPLADAVFALQALGGWPIVAGGSEAIRRRWLPEIAAGRAMAAFAMTEPEAGSDVAAIATRAVRDGGDWVLSGGKHLISNAGIADLYAVFAATDPQAGTRGLSCFLVPADAPGLSFAGAQVLSAAHPLGELAFDDCRVPADHLLGEENRGFHLGMATLDRLRPTVAAAACGMAGRALALARRHVGERRQFGAALASLQLVQAHLADMATELAAARLLAYRAAWEVDTGGGEVTTRAAMAKLAATESAQRIVDAAVQLLGGRGVLLGEPVEHLYRAVRSLRIYEGASDVQRLVIARRLLEGGEGC
jgi:acyl-CoA dehydrogenase